ncbi:hypothetical protein J6590_051398, partial [Homalodisca vitripennis]
MRPGRSLFLSEKRGAISRLVELREREYSDTTRMSPRMRTRVDVRSGWVTPFTFSCPCPSCRDVIEHVDWTRHSPPGPFGRRSNYHRVCTEL